MEILTSPIERKFESLTKKWWSDVTELKKINVSNFPALQQEKNKMLRRAEWIKNKILSIPGYKPRVQLDGAPLVLVGGALVTVVLGIIGMMYKWRLDFKKFDSIQEEFKELVKKLPPQEAAEVMARIRGETYDRQLMWRNIAITAGAVGAIVLLTKIKR